QYDQALEIAHHCPTLQKIVAMKSTIQLQQDPLSCTWESFIETGSSTQQDELTQRLNQKQLSDLFTIIYTSGTTGEPKG
ncbi:AMP-binding protein, partial [Streptococcus pneumoniae]